MRHRMHSDGLIPDMVLVSTARRTQETLEALQPWPVPPIVESTKSLYLAPASRMLALLRHVNVSARRVLLIGHNPGLQDLAMRLVGGNATGPGSELAQKLANAYPTAALAQFDVECPWSEIAEGSGKLRQFIIPRDLKALE
jgi:phosphohistidine phosphatase